METDVVQRRTTNCFNTKNNYDKDAISERQIANAMYGLFMAPIIPSDIIKLTTFSS